MGDLGVLSSGKSPPMRFDKNAKGEMGERSELRGGLYTVIDALDLPPPTRYAAHLPLKGEEGEEQACSFVHLF